MKSLTKKQFEILEFLKSFVKEKGYPPTYREIANQFGFMWTAAKKHLKALEKKGFIKINPSKSRGLEIKDLKTSEIQSIPVLGKIKAGKPTLAIEEIEFYITVDKSLFKSNDLFALRVSGRSMINAGILEDDYVIVRPQATLEDGEIGVFLIDQEATIKRISFDKDKVVLKPENPEMEDQIYPSSEVIIIGKVIGLVRKNF